MEYVVKPRKRHRRRVVVVIIRGLLRILEWLLGIAVGDCFWLVLMLVLVRRRDGFGGGWEAG